jgi:hypothetical protein
MTYLFHEPVLGTIPARVEALRPGMALTIAILGTTAATVLLAALVR